MTRHEKYTQLVDRLRKKTTAQLDSDLQSWRKRMDRFKDTFFQESPPDQLTDGDRIMAIREVLGERA